MNKPLLLLLAIVSVGLGSVIYLQQSKITELTKLYASARQGTAQLAAESESQRGEIAQLKKDTEAFRSESEQLRQQIAAMTAKASGAATKAPAPADADSAKPDAAAAGKAWVKGLSKMFTDPEMKKSMRMQQIVGIRMMYGDLARELQLAPDESEQLLEVLADRQMDMSAAAMAGVDKSAEAAGSTQPQKLTDTQNLYAEKLKAILGSDRYERLKGYEQTIGDRFMLQQFEGQFASAGAPLDPTQKEKLLGLMRDERARSTDTSLNLTTSTNPQAQIEAFKSDDIVANFTHAQETLNRRVLDRARDILTADQVATLERAQQQQLEMMKAQIKMSREFLGMGK